MEFYTIITSKGTTTIPSRIRRELNLTAGSIVEFENDPKSGKVILSKVPTLSEVQKRNQKYLINHKKPLTNKQIDDIVSKSVAAEYSNKHAKNN